MCHVISDPGVTINCLYDAIHRSDNKPSFYMTSAIATKIHFIRLADCRLIDTPLKLNTILLFLDGVIARVYSQSNMPRTGNLNLVIPS